MTVTIEVKPSVKIKTKQAIFVSFPYSVDAVAKIKSLPTRHFEPITKSWEVPSANLKDVLSLFQSYEITLKGKASTKIEKIIDSRVTFDTTSASSFSYKTNPFPHQVEGFEYAQKHTRFLLGDEQGLGKTKQAIDIAVSRKRLFKHTLIVCGVNTLKRNWVREVAIHSNEQAHIIGSRRTRSNKIVDGSNADRLLDLTEGRNEFFLIINVEALRDEKVSSKLADMCEKGTIGLVVVDEIHKCKNPSAEQTKGMMKLNSFFKIAMTGTPLMNNPVDLYVPLKWLDVERHSFYAYKKRYCVMGGYGGYEVVSYQNLHELRQLLDSNMLRRLKDEVLNLPDKIRSNEYVEMTAGQKTLYREVLDVLRKNIDKIRLSNNPLAQLMRLRQVTGAPELLSTKITESAKIERMKELVAEIVMNGKKVIIFSNWEDMTEIARRELKRFNPAYITGSVDATGRDNEVQRFQNDPTCSVIIGTIGSLGTGLTLTAASYVIFLDKPWTMASTEQAEDRAHRIGTTGTVNVLTLICEDSIDERVEEILAEKAELAKGIVEGDKDILDRLSITAGDIDRLLRD